MSLSIKNFKQAKERDGNKCSICERTTNLHVHHIIPRSVGGSNDLKNLITLCSGCHRSIEAGNIANAVFKCVIRALKNCSFSEPDEELEDNDIDFYDLSKQKQ